MVMAREVAPSGTGAEGTVVLLTVGWVFILISADGCQYSSSIDCPLSVIIDIASHLSGETH